MFTGIVTDIGAITEVEERGSGLHIRMQTQLLMKDLSMGASVACGGACMTVVAAGEGANGQNWFEFDASAETLDCTTMSRWRSGTHVNLEPSLRLGDDMGGHMVTGHVDATATITQIAADGDTRRLNFTVPHALAKFIAAKGSVTLDGTSLTVNSVEGNQFSVMLIPHTLQVTTWSDRGVGDPVNLEVDLMARYVARLAE
jgi:riboflavin synthase